MTPNSLLLEFGTYSHTRERAEVSASLIADVLTKALYGSDEQKQVGTVTKLKDRFLDRTKLQVPEYGF